MKDKTESVYIGYKENIFSVHRKNVNRKGKLYDPWPQNVVLLTLMFAVSVKLPTLWNADKSPL